MRYKNIEKNKQNGVVYTPTDMANFLTSLIMKYHEPIDCNKVISILDPAVGGGELLISMIEYLNKNGFKKIKAVGYETDFNVASETSNFLRMRYPNIEIDIRNRDFLMEVDSEKVEKFDFIIANPPYIRTQILGSDRAQEISRKLNLKGKVDIYYAFLIYTKNVLKETGVAGYITSNKFMTIKSGAVVRKYILENYDLRHIVDLGDTKLFTASVLPCIIVFSLGRTTKNSDVSFTTVYENKASKGDNIAGSIFDVIAENGCYELKDGRKFRVQQGTLLSIAPEAVWNISTEEDNEFLKNVETNTWKTFSDLGKIRVGIKTTADNVFIGDNWESKGEKIELLKPLITHRNAGQIIADNDSHWKVLYTHEVVDGKKKAIELSKYPNSQEYLKKHFEQLNSRNYIKKAKRNWYEIWVPQNPSSWSNKKIVFRDITEKPQFWYDESGAVINGDCYWIDINSDVDEDLIFLALAVANSSFIEKYYDIKFNNKLYSGKRRFQSQYVEQFPIPFYTSDDAQQIIKKVKKIIATQSYRDSDKEYIDEMVNKLFSD
ncbi:TPA: N-6 DNA methylase [Streptococcus suis]|nr:N-6 DNA methylase [Streptococcus suis]NQI92731.1 N-6 DNA methylase [Streptococcus suis]NQJ00580.1 N-6 DNA methylase [Streptococcus suis]HEM4248690.1 N-6 DNA methylase [Streptococcus suis]HEM4403673.1 N-6 DNA methylase [Streptococcus suis]